MKVFFSILLFSIMLSSVSGQITSIDTLNETELDFVREVKRYHKDIEFTREVTRHYVMKEGEKVLYYTTFNFTIIDGFYFGNLIDYYVDLSPDLTITYSFSAGTAYSCTGKVYKFDSVFRSEYSWGTGAGTETLWINEKVVFEKTKDF
jgi:hypothetical protein